MNVVLAEEVSIKSRRENYVQTIVSFTQILGEEATKIATKFTCNIIKCTFY